MPPSWARAIARPASVTVSIAADTSGMFRRMLRDSWVERLVVARQDRGVRGHEKHVIEGQRLLGEPHGVPLDAKADYTQASFM